MRTPELRIGTGLTARYFDDFSVGDRFVTASRTVTEADVTAFAGLSGDYNPIHTDKEFGGASAYGERIAHGVLGLAIATGLKFRLGVFDGSVIAVLGFDWNFKAPIRIGDTIHCTLVIEEKRPTRNPERGILFQRIQVLNHHGDVLQEGVHKVMLRTRWSHAE